MERTLAPLGVRGQDVQLQLAQEGRLARARRAREQQQLLLARRVEEALVRGVGVGEQGQLVRLQVDLHGLLQGAVQLHDDQHAKPRRHYGLDHYLENLSCARDSHRHACEKRAEDLPHPIATRRGPSDDP